MTPSDGGIERLERWLAADPASKAFLPLAEEHRRAGHIDRAVEILRAGLAKNPGYATAQVALARVYLQKGDVDEARVLLGRLVEMMPENLLAVRLLAEAEATASTEAHEPEGAASDEAPAPESMPPPEEAGPSADGTDLACPPSPAASDESSFAAVDVTEDGEVPGDLPESIRTLTLARLYRRQGHMERAAVVYRDVLATDPRNRAAQHELAAIVSRPVAEATDGPAPEVLEEIEEKDVLAEADGEAGPTTVIEAPSDPDVGPTELHAVEVAGIIREELPAVDLAPDHAEGERRRKVAVLRAWVDRIRAEG